LRGIIELFERHRILSPVREGPLGVTDINDKIEAFLQTTRQLVGDHGFYHGRPVVITQNDYNLGLFNGDTGISVRDRADGQLKVAFKGVDGQLRLYLASRLPPHESCFAMTVHKSQGSEFDSVALILPDRLPDGVDRILSRELLYTAVTRARRHITLYLDKDTFSRALTRRITRHSGLGERFLPERIISP
jgi:exodeoxyribonuclease V alpha subunit